MVTRTYRIVFAVLAALALSLGLIASGGTASAKPDGVKEARAPHVKLNVQGADSDSPRLNAHAHRLLSTDVLVVELAGADGTWTSVAEATCPVKEAKRSEKADDKRAKPCKARIRLDAPDGTYRAVVYREGVVVAESKTVEVVAVVEDDTEDQSQDGTGGSDDTTETGGDTGTGGEGEVTDPAVP